MVCRRKPVQHMAKKNEFVTTIGFNQNKEEHRRVAGILNRMNRGKADYIVKAVLFYENAFRDGDVLIQEATIDYERVKQYVLQVIEEHERAGYTKSRLEGAPATVSEEKLSKEETVSGSEEIGEEAWGGIFASLESFRK